MNCLCCLLYRVLCESFFFSFIESFVNLFFFLSTPFGSGGTKNLRLPTLSHWSRHMALGVGQSGSHLESQSSGSSFLKKCWSLENPGASLITGLSGVWLFSFFFSPRAVHYPSKCPFSSLSSQSPSLLLSAWFLSDTGWFPKRSVSSLAI